jgi:hypothetical protein
MHMGPTDPSYKVHGCSGVARNGNRFPFPASRGDSNAEDSRHHLFIQINRVQSLYISKIRRGYPEHLSSSSAEERSMLRDQSRNPETCNIPQNWLHYSFLSAVLTLSWYPGDPSDLQIPSAGGNPCQRCLTFARSK